MSRFIYPADGPITQGFGANPAFYAQYGQQGHNGLDIGVPVGTPIHAATAGTVQFEGWGQHNSWMGVPAGICVILNHGDIRTGYAHMNGTVVNAGQAVSQGQLLGYSGSSGAATGPHCHFEFIGTNFNNGYAGRLNPNQFDLGKGDDMIDQVTLTQLFNVMLGRDPDPGAVDHYVGHYTTSFVVNDLLTSAERQQNVTRQATALSSVQAQLSDTQARLVTETATINDLTAQLAEATKAGTQKTGVDEATINLIKDTNTKTNWIQNLLSSVFNRSK